MNCVRHNETETNVLCLSYQYPGLLWFKCLISLADSKLWKQCNHTSLQTCGHSKLTKMRFYRMRELQKGAGWQRHCFRSKISSSGKVTFTIVFKPAETWINLRMTNIVRSDGPTVMTIFLDVILCYIWWKSISEELLPPPLGLKSTPSKNQAESCANCM